MANKRGRKPIFDALELAKELDKYVRESDDPMIAEFCYQRAVSKDTIYRLEKDCKELADSIKKCHTKQEMITVRKAESGAMNATFAIFKLKQKCYGWTDKQETEHTGGLDIKVVWDNGDKA